MAAKRCRAIPLRRSPLKAEYFSAGASLAGILHADRTVPEALSPLDQGGKESPLLQHSMPELLVDPG